MDMINQFASVGSGICLSNCINTYGGSYARLFTLIPGSTFGVAAIIAIASRFLDSYLDKKFDIAGCKTCKEAWAMLAKREIISLAGTIAFGAGIGGLTTLFITGASAVASVAAVAACVWLGMKLCDGVLFHLTSSFLICLPELDQLRNATAETALTLGISRKKLSTELKVPGKKFTGCFEIKNLKLHEGKVYAGSIDDKKRVDTFACYNKDLAEKIIINIDTMLINVNKFLKINDPYKSNDKKNEKKLKISRLLFNDIKTYDSQVNDHKIELESLKQTWVFISNKK